MCIRDRSQAGLPLGGEVGALVDAHQLGQVLFKRFKRIGFIPSPYQIAIRLPKALIGLFYILLCRINAVLHRHALKQLRNHYHKVGIVVIEVNGFCPALYPGCSPGSNAFGQLVGPHTVAGAEVEEHVCQLLLSIIAVSYTHLDVYKRQI